MPALIVDPELVARVVRQFNLKGPLAPFNLTENVIPTFDIGQLTGIAPDPTVVTTTQGSQGVRVGVAVGASLPTQTTAYFPAQVSNSGSVTNPGAATVLVDTGALGTGAHLVHWMVNSDAAAASVFDIEHRNAANSANLAVWNVQFPAGGGAFGMFQQLTMNVIFGERFRIVNPAAITGKVCMTIGVAVATPSVAT